MKNLAEQIISEKTACYFISPAFGDAASATGELLSYLSGKVDITILNIFTKPGEGKLTLSTKRFLKHSGNANPEALYTLNKQEDANALGMLSASVENLGFVDALWRKNKKNNVVSHYIPEFASTYPTYFHAMSGKISKDDKQIEKELLSALRQHINPKNKNFIVFCPIGFFKHVDYLLVRNACLEAYGDNCIFYSLPVEDVLDSEKNNFIEKHNLTPLQFTFSSEIKNKMLKTYESQSKTFFGEDSLVFRPEMYYVQTATESTDLTVKQYKELSNALLKEWQELWDKSSLKNFFNSPLWFQASLETFSYKKPLLLACYRNETLVGILPLVFAEKYGVPAYTSPGNQYYDNSSFLLETYDSHVVETILKKLSEIGNFFLSEVSQPLTTISKLALPSLQVFKSSICPYSFLEPDPYRFLSKKNKRIIAKKFKDAEGNFTCKVYNQNAEEQLRTLLAIDAESSKKAEFKETFSDPLLTKLLKNINSLDPKALVVAILFYKEEPICYNYGFAYGKTYIGSGTAYKEAYRPYAPGRVLAYSLLPELLKMGITLLDFSRGYTRYKRDFAPYAYHQYTLFHSSNAIVMRRWAALESAKAFLEKHSTLFEVVRKAKKMILK